MKTRWQENIPTQTIPAPTSILTMSMKPSINRYKGKVSLFFDISRVSHMESAAAINDNLLVIKNRCRIKFAFIRLRSKDKCRQIFRVLAHIKIWICLALSSAAALRPTRSLGEVEVRRNDSLAC